MKNFIGIFYGVIKTKRFITCKYFFIFLTLLISQNSFGQYSKWQKNITHNGIEFKKVRFRTDGNESMYLDGILKQKTIIQGYPCQGKIILNKEGNLKSFILSESATISGNEFDKETQVHIRNNNDYLIYCLYDPIVQGYQCKRTKYKQLFFMGSTNFQLYPSGKLKYFLPKEDIKIQGVWCKPSAVRGGVLLYESGKLKECTSAKEQTINGKLVGKNYTLKFEENGEIIYAKKEKVFG